MEAIDILIIIVAIAGAVMGFARGVIAQVGQIAAVIGAIVLCRVFGGAVASVIGSPDDLEDVVVAYVIVFIVSYLLIWVVARMLRGVIRAARLGVVDSVAGAVFKMSQWLLILSLAINFYVAVGGGSDAAEAQGKPWRRAVTDFAPAVLGYLSQLNNDAPQDVN